MMADRLTEVVIRVYTPRCSIYRRFKTGIKIEDIRSKGKFITHLVFFDKSQINSLKRLAKEEGGYFEELIYNGNLASGYFVSEGCEVCKPLVSGELFLAKGKLYDDGSMELNFIIPDRRILENILMEYDKNGIDYEIIKVTSFKSEKVLTNHQEKILYIAYKLGLFDHPRRISMEELAKMLGLKTSTVSEVIRRGIRRLLEKYFR